MRFWCTHENQEVLKSQQPRNRGKFYIISAYDWAGLAASMIFRGNISTVEYSIFINELIRCYDNIYSSPTTWQNNMRRQAMEDAKIKLYHDNAS